MQESKILPQFAIICPFPPLLNDSSNILAKKNKNSFHGVQFIQACVFKAFPRGKVAADGLPQTDEGALDLDILVLQALSPKTQKSKAPLIRRRKSIRRHLLHNGEKALEASFGVL